MMATIAFAAGCGGSLAKPVSSPEQTDAETARIGSGAWRAAYHGECPRARDALDVVEARDPAYFAYLTLDPTIAACRQ
jgi:hypothetical protein